MTGSGDSQATIAMNASGQFVVAWTNFNSFGTEVYAETFGATGTSLSGVIPVFQDGLNPSVAMAANGNFVVALDNGGDVSAQLRTADGSILRELAVADSELREFAASVAMNAAGSFVIAFEV